MKKIVVVLWITACILTGCSNEASGASTAAVSSGNTSADSSRNDEQSEEESTEGKITEEADTEAEEAVFPGSYTVPEGWQLAEAHSTAKKLFFVEEGHENDELPDNISIEVGTNRYSADEHELFREAILQQLLRQLQGVSAELNGDGTYTEQGYVVYTFTIKESDMVTVQYYIVDDQRYCLVHLTNFTGEERAYEAARALVDSFVWADSKSD